MDETRFAAAEMACELLRTERDKLQSDLTALQEVAMETLEAISQKSEDCIFCGAVSYPVKGDRKGYAEVTAEDAEEYHIDHNNDCIVWKIEEALKK